MNIQNTLTIEKPRRNYRFLLLAGIVFVSFNLRPSITSVGPLVGIIRDDMGFSNWSVGILTSLPLIAFAIMSPIAPKIGNRITNERALVVGLFILIVGISIRSIPMVLFLFMGTLLIGLGIAVCNVLLPGVIKEKYPLKVALMTSVYSTTMNIFAAFSTGLSIPLAKGMNLGWEITLLVWVIPALFAIIIWIFISKKNHTDHPVQMKYVRSSDKLMWRSPLAWQVALFMGLQSLLFYVIASWLPEILHSYGASKATAGWMLSFSQFVGLPASFFVPVIAGRFKSQRGIVLVMGLFIVSGLAGLLFGNSFSVMVVSVTLIGSAMSGNFALALSFLGMRSRNSRQAAELSGMAQSLGYLLAATGPIFIGFLFDLTRAWTVPLTTLIVVAILVMVFGMGAGRDKYVSD